MEKPIIFTNLPLCDELCHILVSIDPNEKKDKSVKSDFQWQLLKTRLLLYSESNIIATPATRLLRHINVISKKTYFNSGSLSALFHKLKLKVESVAALSLALYEQCLIYNLIVKLSPTWNRVEKYFVEGRYFLMHRGVLHAVELNIILRGDMLILYASPLRLWLREVPLFDLLPSSNIEETLSKPFYIDLNSERQWVHVLPSFKRGQLVYVTNRIPKDSTFDDYLQIRRHWKNTYGYRLPENDSSSIYVGISFFGNTDYLYPLECVRRGMHMNGDEPNVVANFAKAVAVKASFICGNRIKLRNLSELQNMPRIKITKRFKWSESGLAELDSDLLNKWLFQGGDSANITFADMNDNNISLYMEQENCQMPFKTVEDHPKKEKEYDNWLTNCSQFIDTLTKGAQKRSFLKACRPIFNETSQTSPLKTYLKSQPSTSKLIKVEGSFDFNGKNQNTTDLFKTPLNVTELNVSTQKESSALSSEKQHQIKAGSNSDTAICERKIGHKNEIPSTNVVLFADVPFKPIFNKKKSIHSKEAIKTCEEGKKEVSRLLGKSKSVISKSRVNARKNNSNEEVKKKRAKKKKEKETETLKEKNIVMSSAEAEVKVKIDLNSFQETTAKGNDKYCEGAETTAQSQIAVIEDEKINYLKAVDDQVTDQLESNSTINFEKCPLADLALDTISNEDKSKIRSFVSDIKALSVANEHKNIDVTTKLSVVKKLNTPTSAPKERKKSILLTTNEIENLVFMNQLEKANVPSLCCYLKGKGVPFSKERKKDILLGKVREIVISRKRE